MGLGRRAFLQFGAAGAAGGALMAVPFGGSVSTKSASSLDERLLPKPYRVDFARSPVTRGDWVTNDGGFRLVTVTEGQFDASILPGGLRTPVFGYNGAVPGPTVDVDRGERVKMRVRNRLPAKHPQFGYPFNTATHLHGSASLPQYDGYADDLSRPGYYKDYLYPNHQPARTMWYHDHGVHTTAPSVYSGLAGQYHVHDDAERALLPQGEYDVPLTLTDLMFRGDGKLGYDDNSDSGLWGDVVLVNGRPWPVMKVKPCIYRFRILNASIARSYRLLLSNGQPLVVVATDGGLVPRAAPVPWIRHGNGERYEVLIDFSKYAGRRVELRNASNDNNVDYDHTGKVMAFDVQAVDGPLGPVQYKDGTPSDRNGTVRTMPTTLAGSAVMDLSERAATVRRTLRVERGGSRWNINGMGWADVVRSGYTKVVANPAVGATEIWTVENNSGGWFHPVHIHLVDFKILSRSGGAGRVFDFERGPKDVVYVGEGETVRLLMRFDLPPGDTRGGRYMVHCHNLPHEDHDMMVQYSVGDAAANDPVTSAPSRVDGGRYDDTRYDTYRA